MNFCKDCVHYRIVFGEMASYYDGCANNEVLESYTHIDPVNGNRYIEYQVNKGRRYEGMEPLANADIERRSGKICGHAGNSFERYEKITKEHKVLWFKWTSTKDERVSNL